MVFTLVTGASTSGSFLAAVNNEETFSGGYDITAHRAKLLTVNLVKQFDLPIAMDRTHLAALRWMVARERQDIPTLLMRFAPELNLDEVADPYGGPAAGYDAALDLIEAGCRGLFEGFRSELKAARSG